MNKEDLLKIENSVKCCPFCGKKPLFDYFYSPTGMSVYCGNSECKVRPNLEISVTSKLNAGGKSYTPLFSNHVDEVIELWNRRFS